MKLSSDKSPPRPISKRAFLALACVFAALLACARGQTEGGPFWSISRAGLPTDPAGGQSSPTPAPWSYGPKRTPGAPILTPTPDSPHALPPVRTQAENYTIQPGDSLGMIARNYGVTVELILGENEIADPNLLSVGQLITIPAPPPAPPGPDFKVLPDSELVYGPYSVLFDVEAFIQDQGGFLSTYYEEINEEAYSGAQVVKRIAEDYSINPRLLLAVLEHQSGWLTNPQPVRGDVNYPMSWKDPNRKGLYRQLNWAANNLNRGYYLWRAGAIASWTLTDGSIVPVNPTINAGTAGVQYLYSLLYDRASWETAVSGDGVAATFNALFGYPFDYAIEPLIPVDLFQPALLLPFEPGAEWYYTGGPHGGWGDGSAWAALDFAPPGAALGCVPNEAWITAVADGKIIRAQDGAVMQDLDGDGLEQTGWVVLYMHVDTNERVQAGTFVEAGERIGHPSCEGGVSSGTHLHLARRYNGEWIPAAHTLPFVLEGWVAQGTGNEYDGYLSRAGVQIEAYAGIDRNSIAR